MDSANVYETFVDTKRLSRSLPLTGSPRLLRTMLRSGSPPILDRGRQKSGLSRITTTSMSKSVYTSKIPFEKQASEMAPLRRVASTPCTREEILTNRYTTIIGADLLRDSDGNFDLDEDFNVDDDMWDPEFRRPMLPVQAVNAHNSSLRYVSDSRTFWKTYAREKWNQRERSCTMAMPRRKLISSSITVN